MLEVKHQVAQLICAKTRCQITTQAMPGEDIVLAKGGVQVVLKASNSLSNKEYRQLQNEKMLNLYLNRRPGKRVVVSQFPSIRDQWETGIDLHKFERRVLLSLEYDLKRRPVEPKMIEVSGRRQPHLAFNTQPWESDKEFNAARVRMDCWRRKNVLKTMEDWQSQQDAMQFSLARSRRRAAGDVTMNLRGEKGSVDVLRRAFMRAYAQKQLGLTRTMKYADLAAWLTQQGYPTKATEPRSARAQPLALRGVPRTEPVMALLGVLQGQFPTAGLEQLLAPPPGP
jgi:hypothetical protein